MIISGFQIHQDGVWAATEKTRSQDVNEEAEDLHLNDLEDISDGDIIKGNCPMQSKKPSFKNDFRQIIKKKKIDNEASCRFFMAMPPVLCKRGHTNVIKFLKKSKK